MLTVVAWFRHQRYFRSRYCSPQTRKHLPIHVAESSDDTSPTVRSITFSTFQFFSPHRRGIFNQSTYRAKSGRREIWIGTWETLQKIKPWGTSAVADRDIIRSLGKNHVNSARSLGKNYVNSARSLNDASEFADACGISRDRSIKQRAKCYRGKKCAKEGTREMRFRVFI